MIKEDDIILCNDERLSPRAISEDGLLRNGELWPEYAHTLMLCVDSFDRELAAGRLYSFCIQGPLPFNSLDQMFLGLEAILDESNLVRACLEKREFEKRGRRKSAKTGDRGSHKKFALRKSALPFGAVHPVRGKIANFYLRVYSRQHASMQGYVAQTEFGCKPSTFRSVLELMHLLHDALRNRVTIRADKG